MMKIFEERIAHHEANARAHVAGGKPEWADGARKKADRWRKRAAEFEAVITEAHPLGRMMADQVISGLVSEFEASILYGDNRP